MTGWWAKRSSVVAWTAWGEKRTRARFHGTVGGGVMLSGRGGGEVRLDAGD